MLRKNQISLFVFFIFFNHFVLTQVQQSRIVLPTELNEISGLELYNDSILIGINDSGNQQAVYFFKTNGKIIHKCLVFNAKNIDWEDLCRIGDTLFIADVGNNLNNRRDLGFYTINVNEAFNNDSLMARSIYFTYSNQKSFPEMENHLEFDCEASFVVEEQLFIITKSRATPWKGYAYTYPIDKKTNYQNTSVSDSILIGKKGWQQDAVTAAYSKEKKLYLLTYNRIIILEKTNEKWRQIDSINIKKKGQTEGICVDSKNTIYLAAEKHFLLKGPYLYTINQK